MDDAPLSFAFEAELGLPPLATLKQRTDVVCRLWLRRRCAKDQICVQLHIYDEARLPVCLYGAPCANANKFRDVPCIMQHRSEDDKDECVNYRLGFCSFGATCEYRHVPLVLDSEISELWRPENAVTERHRRESERPGGTWRSSICKFFAGGQQRASSEERDFCPYFEQCKYAHSEAELRRPNPGSAAQAAAYGRGGAQATPQAAAARLAMLQSAAQAARAQALAAQPPGDPSAPDVAALSRMYEAQQSALRAQGFPDLGANGAAGSGGGGGAGCSKYFVVRTTRAANIAMSLRRGEWIAPRAAGEQVSRALRESAVAAGETGGTPAVFLLFSVVGSRAFQGVARVRAPPRVWEGAATTGVSVEFFGGGGGGNGGGSGAGASSAAGSSAAASSSSSSSASATTAAAAPPSSSPSSSSSSASSSAAASELDDEALLAVVPVEWLRTCALPMARTRNLRNPLAGSAPVACSRDWAELPGGLGRALMVLAFQAPQVRVEAGGDMDDVGGGGIGGGGSGGAGGSAGGSAGGEAAVFSVLDEARAEAAALLDAEDFGPEVAAARAGLVWAPPPPPGGARASGAEAAAAHSSVPVTDWVRLAGPAEAVAAAGSAGLPRLLAASPLIVGTPATGPGPADATVAMLLDGVLPPNAPARNGLAVLAAAQVLSPEKRLLMLVMSGPSAQVAIASGVLAATADAEAAGAGAGASGAGADARMPRDLREVAPGTPICVFDPQTRTLHGLFLARGPCARELAPALVPRAGSSSMPMQVPVMCVADAAPLPEAALPPSIRQLPSRIGFFAVRESHEVVAMMIGSLPPPAQFATYALLRQMALTGAFPFLVQDGVPAPIGPVGRPILVDEARAALAAAGLNPLPLPEPRLPTTPPAAMAMAMAIAPPAGFAHGGSAPPPLPPPLPLQGSAAAAPAAAASLLHKREREA